MEDVMDRSQSSMTGTRRRLVSLIFLCCISLLACKIPDDKVLPRNQSLPLFNPHVADFICENEASKVPPIDAQAEDWFFDTAITRAIHLDIRYMLWVMKKVDHADNLLKEMTIKYPKPVTAAKK